MDYGRILADAHAAARAAIIQANPVDTYPCGFVWVTVDGNDGLARFCRAEIKRLGGEHSPQARDFGSKAHPRGWQFWKPGNWRGQNVDGHEIGARAFRDALAAHGIVATIGSRLD
jgi:hypothetical protein